MKEKLQQFFKLTNLKDKNPSKKTKYLIVIALVGLLLIILANAFTTTNKTMNDPQINNVIDDKTLETVSKESSTDSIVTELEKSYEDDLIAMLNNIQGVSEAEVMVNLDSTNVLVYEKNLIRGQQTTDESDKNGGIRKIEDQTEETQVVLVRQGDQEVPLLVQTEKPKVRGVFIVAKGADHAAVKMWIIEAISKVLDVPTHKVSVMPKS